MQVQGPYTSISAFDRGDDYDEYGVCIAYVFVHPEGKSLTSNGRVFESGTVIKAGEQLPTQQILAHCQPIVKTVRARHTLTNLLSTCSALRVRPLLAR